MDGSLVVLLILIFHLFLVPNRWMECYLVGSVALFGTMIDSVWAATGLITYEAPYSSFSFICPPWVTAIYVLFAMCLNYSLLWLRGRPFIGASLAILGAILSYAAAEKVGAAQFHPNSWVVLALVGLVWGFFMPFCSWWSSWLDKMMQDKKTG